MTMGGQHPTLVNGEPADGLPVEDRGFRYGDGLFETIKVCAGAPEFWAAHIGRLCRDAERLNLAQPEAGLLAAEARRLLGAPRDGVLRIWLTRGPGGPGYRPEKTAVPTRMLRFDPHTAATSPDPAQEGVRLRICQTRLGQNPALAGIKHLNRLEQVLAAQEWDDPAIAEGLMLDGAGHLIEGTKTNVFFVCEGRLITPELTEAGVAGVLREVVLAEAKRANFPVKIRPVRLAEALAAEECFLTNSLVHLWPVREIDGKAFAIGPVTDALARRVEATAKAGRGLPERGA